MEIYIYIYFNLSAKPGCVERLQVYKTVFGKFFINYFLDFIVYIN